MDDISFETALAARVDDMIDACTRCGKCVEACPSVAPAGLAAAKPEDVITGVIDILRTGNGADEARKWASSCMLSGACIKACDEGVNPRFLLSMARVALAKATNELPARRRQAIENFRNLGRDVGILSRLQLSGEALARLGQRPPHPAPSAPPSQAPLPMLSSRTARPGRADPGPKYPGIGGESTAGIHGSRLSRPKALGRDDNQKAAEGETAIEAESEEPDFVFYTGCNVLKTPHIALLALDIMDALGATYRVMGGPSHCCGVVHMRAGDTEVTGRMATSTLDKLAQSKSGQVVSWCPSCYVQFTETTLPTIERQRGARPFEMTPFMLFLKSRLDDLRPLLHERVALRIALHRHPGVAGVAEAAEAILRAIPGLKLVDLHQPAVGLQSVNLGVLPAYKRELQRTELEAARAAGVDALAAVYHSDHRELCAHERDWPFRIVNVLEIVGASMGLHEADHYKRLKVMQDADAILADCRDLIAANGLDAEVARAVVLKGLLGDQPLPLAGAAV